MGENPAPGRPPMATWGATSGPTNTATGKQRTTSVEEGYLPTDLPVKLPLGTAGNHLGGKLAAKRTIPTVAPRLGNHGPTETADMRAPGRRTLPNERPRKFGRRGSCQIADPRLMTVRDGMCGQVP
jgi:hypothetical protein